MLAISKIRLILSFGQLKKLLKATDRNSYIRKCDLMILLACILGTKNLKFKNPDCENKKELSQLNK